jgi:hypothetical protein
MTRKTAKALAEIDGQIAGLREIEARFHLLGATGIDEVGDAWNSVHDAITALEAHRRWVEMEPLHAAAIAQNPGGYALAAANID